MIEENSWINVLTIHSAYSNYYRDGTSNSSKQQVNIVLVINHDKFLVRSDTESQIWYQSWQIPFCIFYILNEMAWLISVLTNNFVISICFLSISKIRRFRTAWSLSGTILIQFNLRAFCRFFLMIHRTNSFQLNATQQLSVDFQESSLILRSKFQIPSPCGHCCSSKISAKSKCIATPKS